MPLKTAFEGVTYNGYVEGTEIERLWLLGESPTVPNEQVESRIPAISNARREWLARNAQALGRCDDGSALAAVAELSREEARGTSRVISGPSLLSSGRRPAEQIRQNPRAHTTRSRSVR